MKDICSLLERGIRLKVEVGMRYAQHVSSQAEWQNHLRHLIFAGMNYILAKMCNLYQLSTLHKSLPHKCCVQEDKCNPRKPELCAYSNIVLLPCGICRLPWLILQCVNNTLRLQENRFLHSLFEATIRYTINENPNTDVPAPSIFKCIYLAFYATIRKQRLWFHGFE